jgi:hypothetical protein
MPVITVLMWGAVDWMDTGEHRRQQAVVGHDHEDARLTDDHHQHHRGQPDQRADFDHQRSQPSCGCAATAVTTGSSVPSCG